MEYSITLDIAPSFTTPMVYVVYYTSSCEMLMKATVDDFGQLVDVTYRTYEHWMFMGNTYLPKDLGF